MVNQALLKTVAECEYPEEFLVARLLGKKGALFRNWEFLIASSDAVKSLQNTPFYPYLKKFGIPGIWHFLHHEHLWVYSRMNNRLRAYFNPYFAYHEINTLHVCLRSLWSSKTTERISQELRNSLLHKDIQEILSTRREFTRMLYELELRLCAYSHHFAGLGACYENKGIIGVEVFLWDSFFSSLFSQKQPLLLKRFFHYLVDYYNCMFVAKSLRWEVAAEPLTIPGGTVPSARFKKAYLRKDLTPVLRFLRLDNPEAAASTLPKLEISLLRSITFKLKAWSYQRTVVADILFYLWEQYRYRRNISMILTTVLLEDEPVRESLVA
jgi:hypothetical protein